jgi:hypothetical protein
MTPLVILKRVAGTTMWLKAVSPVTKWGPRSHAIEFTTAGEAKRTLGRLARKLGSGALIAPANAELPADS